MWNILESVLGVVGSFENLSIFTFLKQAVLVIFGKVFSSPIGRDFKSEWWSSFFGFGKKNSMFLLSLGSIMHENAREKEARATHEHHHTPPPLGCLLSRFQHICSFHLFTFFQPLLFSVPCPSHRTLILAEAGQSWDQKREQNDWKPQPLRFRHWILLTKFTISAQRWVWMRKGIEIQDTARASAALTAQALNHKAL